MKMDFGIGYFSRQGAKAPSSEKIFFSKPLRPCGFAGDNPNSFLRPLRSLRPFFFCSTYNTTFCRCPVCEARTMASNVRWRRTA